jgi:hypothetical protein
MFIAPAAFGKSHEDLEVVSRMTIEPKIIFDKQDEVRETFNRTYEQFASPFGRGPALGPIPGPGRSQVLHPNR